MKRIAVVNFANENGWYQRGAERLRAALYRFHTEIDFFTFNYEEKIGAPSHKENPYAFKVYCIEKMRKLGYDIVIYADSSIDLIKPITPILNLIEEQGYYFDEAGHIASNWANDRCLDYFKITRDDAEKILMYSAGFTCLDFTREIAREFFAQWKNACDAGIFKGSWSNDNRTESQDARCKGHRHDMTCASIIATKLKMNYTKGGKYLAYVGSGYSEPGPEVVIYLHPC